MHQSRANKNTDSCKIFGKTSQQLNCFRRIFKQITIAVIAFYKVHRDGIKLNNSPSPVQRGVGGLEPSAIVYNVTGWVTMVVIIVNINC